MRNETMLPRVEPRTWSAAPGRLRLILWFALATALVQVSLWIVARYVVRRAVVFDLQVIWMAPVANLVVFGAAGLVLLGLGRWAPRLRGPAVWIGTFLGLACYTILLMVPRVHQLALLALAAGVGLQAGRWLSRRLGAMRRLVHATLLPLGFLALLAAAAVNGRMLLHERRVLARTAGNPGGAPNVLLVIWDTVRSASLSLYGYERDTTPFLDAFAARSTVFDRAFATASWTLPSHGSLFTGHYPYDLTAGWKVPLDGRYPVLAEALAAEGYTTGGFVANRVFGSHEYGLARGFDHYEARPLSIGRVLTSSSIIELLYDGHRRWIDPHQVLHARSASQLTGRFWRWRDRLGDRPYFAFLNYFDAHEPYTPPPPYDKQFGDPRVRKVITDRRPTEAELADVRDAYDGAIRYLDEQLRGLIAELERRGELENTLIILTSDHGEHVGEYGLMDHGISLYSPLLHVPLLLSWPGRVPQGLRTGHAVSLRDLPRTVVDLLGSSERAEFPGRSLARTWSDSATDEQSDTILAQLPFARGQPDWYPLAAGDMRSVLLWPLQLIVNDGNGREEVFDLARDPMGLHDLSTELPRADVERLRAALAAYPARTRVEVEAH
jgi:arylsulfatase A-like enzyme